VIRFGILGTARIARALLGYPLEGIELSAVASRSRERAVAFAREGNIPGVFGSYEELLDDSSIDAVYIALPPRLNGVYAAKAIEAGKHVLVEKPAVVSIDQVRVIEASLHEKKTLFMEGLMYRFMALHRRSRELVTDGTIGDLRYVNFNFCFDILARGRTGYRTEKGNGGGALYDLGIYGVDFLRYINGESPVLLHALTSREDQEGIDLFTHAFYRLGDAVAALTCSFNADANYYVLSGNKGSITAPVAISGRQVPSILRIHLLEGDRKYEESFEPENPYKTEIEYFARCITDGEEPFLGIGNTRANIEMLEQIFETGQPL